MKHFEHSNRSLVKTISYRLIIIASTLIIVFLLTGEIQTTIDVTIISSIANTILYFFHERIWNKIHWGKVS
jgi:uncharacterized membrane protein